MGKFFKTEEKDCACEKVNVEYFEDGGNIGGGGDEGDANKSQTPYHAASNACVSLDTVVPSSMASEQKKFNERLKAAVAAMGMSVEQYVAKKLHYRSVDELCFQGNDVDQLGRRVTRLAVEQIDAVATAIWNHETNGVAIIIADQTGTGKGRCGAALMRYAILELKKVPIFLTEKKHLINDIYRDLIAVGLEAGVPKKIKKTIVVDKKEFTDDEIFKIIINDIKEKDDVRVEFDFPESFNLELLKKTLSETDEKYDEVEEVKEELIHAYRQLFQEVGYEKDVYEINAEYDEQVRDAVRNGKIQLVPFIPNLIDVKDINGNILYEATAKDEANEIYKLKKVGTKWVEDENIDSKIDELILPSKYKLIAMPYSQLGSGKTKVLGREVFKSKIKLFLKYSHKTVFVLDEAHNASGSKGGGELSNTGELVFQMVKNSAMTTYVSATYAKRPDNMPLYALRTSIKDAGLSDQEMIEVFDAGGNALQEAVSAELVRNGQLLRREKIIQGKSEYYYENEESEIGKNQTNKLNRIAHLFQLVLDFSNSVKGEVFSYKKGLTDEEKEKIKPARGVGALSFQLFNFMLLGMKVKQTTEFAINGRLDEKGERVSYGLNQGRKVVIAVASTMESALDNLSKTFLSNRDTDSYKIGDTIKNDFSLYMAYLLNYTMRYYAVEVKVDKEENKTEERQLVYVLDSSDDLSLRIRDRLYSKYTETLSEILAFETGVPIAPIDMIEKAIKDAGFSVSEITGRQRKISFNEETNVGTIVRRDIKKTDAVIRDFNENETDCLIINQSGATGVSMHALPNDVANIYYPTEKDENGNDIEKAPTSLENKKEVKKRSMIITEMERDVNKEVQKLGRINRMGQVYQPEYTYVISAIPSESRLSAIMEKKLRSLSSNVSSNQQQASYLFSSDDFFSEVAIAPFNETLEVIGMRNVSKATTGSDIYEFTKSMYFKEYKLQKDFYDTFSKKLNEEVVRLKSQGLYVGQMESKDYAAETITKHPFYLGNNNSKTSFGGHAFIEKCTVRLFKERYTEAKIKKEILAGLVIKQSNEEDYFAKDVFDYQQKALKVLDTYVIQKTDFIGKVIEDLNKQKSEEEVVLAEAQKKSLEFADIQKAIDLEKRLRELNETKSSLSTRVAEAINNGNLDVMQSLTPEIAQVTSEIKAVQEQIKPMEHLLENKSDVRRIEREIKSSLDEIAYIETKKEREKKTLNEFLENINYTKLYLQKIGQIVKLTVYEEKTLLDEDGAEDLASKAYSLKFSKPFVVTGVSFPDSSSIFTAGKVEISLTGVSEKYSYSLFRIERKFQESKATETWYRPQEMIEYVAENFENKWNEIAGKTDNSYRENKYMIVGSILKTFSLGKANSISGQIVKYNTIEGKNRIGVEVSDVEDTDKGKQAKNLYKILDERYGENANKQNVIYYDGNLENIQRFIFDYIYWFLFGETYASVEKNETQEARGYSANSAANRFFFQVSSNEHTLFLEVKIDNYYYDEARQLVTSYSRGESILLTKKVEKEELFRACQINFHSDTISGTDAIAYYLEKAVGVPINSENYLIALKSRVFKEIQPSNYNRTTIRFPYGAQLKTMFATDIKKMDEYVSFGVKTNAELKMSYENFIALMKYFNENRANLTFATSNTYFEKHKSEYILEQFLDDAQEDVAGVVDVDMTEDIIQKEVSEMIDELVKLITKK